MTLCKKNCWNKKVLRGRIESMQQSPATLKNDDVGRGLPKIVVCSQSSSQCLLVPTVFVTVSSLLHLFHSFFQTISMAKTQ